MICRWCVEGNILTRKGIKKSPVDQKSLCRWMLRSADSAHSKSLAAWQLNDHWAAIARQMQRSRDSSHRAVRPEEGRANEYLVFARAAGRQCEGRE